MHITENIIQTMQEIASTQRSSQKEIYQKIQLLNCSYKQLYSNLKLILFKITLMISILVNSRESTTLYFNQFKEICHPAYPNPVLNASIFKKKKKINLLYQLLALLHSRNSFKYTFMKNKLTLDSVSHHKPSNK